MGEKRVEAKLNLSESMEDYLETILDLIKKNGSARVTDIANSLGIAASSVNEGINKLNKIGLVNQEKYGPIKLTAKGRKAAEKIYCIHQILYIFFNDFLDVSSEIADEDACKIEHRLSQESLKSIIELLIANNKLEKENCAIKFLEQKEEQKDMAVVEDIILADLAVGSRAKISKIESSGKLKRKLMDMGLNRGARVEVKGKAPMGDPIKIKVRGYSLSLRRDEAAKILVKEVIN